MQVASGRHLKGLGDAEDPQPQGQEEGPGEAREKGPAAREGSHQLLGFQAWRQPGPFLIPRVSFLSSGKRETPR